MKERPIIMTGESIPQILAGKKTQTRRPVGAGNSLVNGDRVPKATWGLVGADLGGARMDPGPSPAGNPGPYLQVPLTAPGWDGAVYRVYPAWRPGDLLWVREAFALSLRDPDSAFEPDPCNAADWDDVVYRADGENQGGGWDHYEDGKLVGRVPPPWRSPIFMPRWASRLTLEVVAVRVERLQAITEEDARAEGCEAGPDPWNDTALRMFYRHWEELHGEGSWAANPWVWVVEFRPVATDEGGGR